MFRLYQTNLTLSDILLVEITHKNVSRNYYYYYSYFKLPFMQIETFK